MQKKIVSNKTNLPELLLPAGNIENFRAAIKGGADAIYLGLSKFNARGRALNFTNKQFVSILSEAKEKGVKVYVTVNTVIKNNEISDLLDMIWFLSKTSVSAIIIQDWGVYYLAKKYSQNIVLHASTQMGNHNSIGANYSKKKGFERVILARELTEKELFEIKKNTSIDLEIFVHGALCYSFSGMCMFSSFNGGAGANRGVCTQNCRRVYIDGDKKHLFSLKDFQLIDKIQEIVKLGIASVKVEGRLKSAEYVYTVANAYRKAIDNFKNISEAKEQLKFDFAREKTSYFFGGNVSDAITENTNIGVFLGEIIEINDDNFVLSSDIEILVGYRMRVISKKNVENINLKVISVVNKLDNLYEIKVENSEFIVGDKVYLIGGFEEMKFSNKIKEITNAPSQQMHKLLKDSAFKAVKTNNSNGKQKIFIRINSLKWLTFVKFSEVDFVILNLSASEITEFNPATNFIKTQSNKIFIELPKFISEGKIKFYKNICEDLYRKGINNFMLSHISQKMIIPLKANFSTNENVYVFNDAASKFLSEEMVKYFTYPLENDFENYYSMRNREGLVPVYFHPDLFYSRMPVKIENAENEFVDESKTKYKKTVIDGVTIVRPKYGVSFLQFKSKFEKLGYRNFLLNFSGELPSKENFEKILKAFNFGNKIEETTLFNLKRELK